MSVVLVWPPGRPSPQSLGWRCYLGGVGWPDPTDDPTRINHELPSNPPSDTVQRIMALFDTYRPVPALHCPACRQPLDGWQGTDGPCLLLAWDQGRAAPVAQDVNQESRLPEEVIARQRLPDEFDIYTEGCHCGRIVKARGSCVGGAWTETGLITPANARPGPTQSDREFHAYIRDLGVCPSIAFRP